MRFNLKLALGTAVSGFTVFGLILTAAPARADVSDLYFHATTPISAGETVKGLITGANGVTMLGDVKVDGEYTDDMFTFWTGKYNGTRYYYDIYTTYWRPGPIGYQRATLQFRGDTLNGRVRSFGSYLDINNFFAEDGVLYKRVNIERNRTRNTNSRRKIIRTYFVNMDTLERSDTGGAAYTVIGSVDKQWLADQMQAREDMLAQVVKQWPAFPMWQTTAFVAPDEIVVANGAPPAGDDMLLQPDVADSAPMTLSRGGN